MCSSMWWHQKTSLAFLTRRQIPPEVRLEPVSVTGRLGCTTAGPGVLQPNIHCFCPGKNLSETTPMIACGCYEMMTVLGRSNSYTFWKCLVCLFVLEICFCSWFLVGFFGPVTQTELTPEEMTEKVAG